MTSLSSTNLLPQHNGSHDAGSKRWTPHKYQRRAVKWLVEKPEAALFLDPGLGKTSISLAAFVALRKAGAVRKALVVAPLRPCSMVWSKSGELGKWSDFNELSVSLIHGNESKRLKAINVDADLYVINFEGLVWLSTADRGRLMYKLIKSGVDLLIVDELSKMKSSKTKRFKALKTWLGSFKRRWGLTGSPVANGMLDLFGQIYTLDLGKRLGRYITHYRNSYFNSTGYGGYTWVLRAGADKEIYARLKDIALSMRAEDHLDLPKLVESNVWVDLPPKARRIYRDMHEELVAMLDSGEVTAANAAVASGKCRQIASGGLYHDDIDDDTGFAKRMVEHVHDAKTEALVDLVEELQGSPLLVGFEFHHDLDRIRKGLKKVVGDVPAITGGTGLANSSRYAAQWNAGELPVLCGHPAAMAHGINLQACGHHICWYSPTWNFELYDQFVRRVYRQGQRNRVIVYRLLARDTVDEAIARALSKKERGQSALLSALKKMKRRP